MLQTAMNRPSRRRNDQRTFARVASRALRPVKPSDGILEALPVDKPHGVEGTPGRVVAQAVDGDDPRVLQLPGDLGFHEESGPALGVVGVPVEDLLQRDLAVQLLVLRHEDGA